MKIKPPPGLNKIENATNVNKNIQYDKNLVEENYFLSFIFFLFHKNIIIMLK